MKKPKKPKPASSNSSGGSASMKAAGRYLVWATFTDDERRRIRMAAAAEDVTMAAFVQRAALEAAEKNLKNSGNNP